MSQQTEVCDAIVNVLEAFAFSISVQSINRRNVVRLALEDNSKTRIFVQPAGTGIEELTRGEWLRNVTANVFLVNRIEGTTDDEAEKEIDDTINVSEEIEQALRATTLLDRYQLISFESENSDRPPFSVPEQLETTRYFVAIGVTYQSLMF